MSEEAKSTEMLALESLEPSLNKLESGREEAVSRAIDSVAGIALVSKKPETGVRAIGLLGNYSALPRTDATSRWDVLNNQKKAASEICAIALVLQHPDVDNAALVNLGKRLNAWVLGEKGTEHIEPLLDLAIVAIHSRSAQKEMAIGILKEYANKPIDSHGGSVGKNAFPHTQKLANELIGVIGVS